MAYLLALDQGTSSSRAVVFNEQGYPTGISQLELTQLYPQPGHVEHDPEEIWTSQLQTAKEAIRNAGISAEDIAAIGITNQRETIVVWDRATGKPLHNAIVWQDRRTAPKIEQLKSSGAEPDITAKTGLVLDPYFSATKIGWILDAIPGARERAERGELAAGTVDSWLIWKLSGGRMFATDITNASRTLLFNIHTCEWDPDLLKLFNIPRTLLPEVKPSSGFFVETIPEHFGIPLRVSGVAGDQQAALFGQLCTEPGMAKNTYGTGCFILMQTGTHAVTSRNRLLTTIAWQLEGQPVQYALEGSVFVAGAAIQWLRDGLGLIRSAPDINELAAQVPDSGGVTVVPAFTGLGAPHWNPDARGIITGLTRGSTAAHIAHATLEAIACESTDVLRAMEADTGTPLKEIRVDGGASQSDLLMQMQADLLNIPICRPKIIETTALGTAYLAGLAEGVWENLDELKKHWQLECIFKSTIDNIKRREIQSRWANAVGKA